MNTGGMISIIGYLDKIHVLIIMANDKRKKLIAAAKKLFVEKGYQATTLAMIAQESGVPLGNVYYYFKSKEAFMDSVLNQMSYDMDDKLQMLGALESPQERLRAFVDHSIEVAESLSQHGDSLLNIAKETAGINQELRDKVSSLGENLQNWICQQFGYMNALEGNSQGRLFLQRYYGLISLAVVHGKEEKLKDSLQALLRQYRLQA